MRGVWVLQCRSQVGRHHQTCWKTKRSGPHLSRGEHPAPSARERYHGARWQVVLHHYVGGKKGKTKRGVVAVTKSMEYRGSAAESCETAKYLVGVYKPSKGKLYLMEAGQVLKLPPVIVMDLCPSAPLVTVVGTF